MDNGTCNPNILFGAIAKVTNYFTFFLHETFILRNSL
jgi:hypothetical protein